MSWPICQMHPLVSLEYNGAECPVCAVTAERNALQKELWETRERIRRVDGLIEVLRFMAREGCHWETCAAGNWEYMCFGCIAREVIMKLGEEL